MLLRLGVAGLAGLVVLAFVILVVGGALDIWDRLTR